MGDVQWANPFEINTSPVEYLQYIFHKRNGGTHNIGRQPISRGCHLVGVIALLVHELDITHPITHNLLSPLM